MAGSDLLADIPLEEIPAAQIYVKNKATENNNALHNSPLQKLLRAMAAFVPLNSKDPMTEAKFKHDTDHLVGEQDSAPMKELFLKWLKEQLLIKRVVAFALTIGTGLRVGFTCLASTYLSVFSAFTALVEPLLKTYAFVNPEFNYFQAKSGASPTQEAPYSHFFAKGHEGSDFSKASGSSSNAEILRNSSPQSSL